MFNLDARSTPEAAALFEQSRELPRIKALDQVHPDKLYLGFTASPPEATFDITPRRALFGPFDSVEQAGAAADLLRTFCRACGTGLVMADIFWGTGRKVNNSLVMNVACYLRSPEQDEWPGGTLPQAHGGSAGEGPA